MKIGTSRSSHIERCRIIRVTQFVENPALDGLVSFPQIQILFRFGFFGIILDPCGEEIVVLLRAHGRRLAEILINDRAGTGQARWIGILFDLVVFQQRRTMRTHGYLHIVVAGQDEGIRIRFTLEQVALGRDHVGFVVIVHELDRDNLCLRQTPGLGKDEAQPAHRAGQLDGRRKPEPVPDTGTHTTVHQIVFLRCGQAQGKEFGIARIVGLAVMVLDIGHLVVREIVFQERQVEAFATVVEEAGHRESFSLPFHTAVRDGHHNATSETTAVIVAEDLVLQSAAGQFFRRGVTHVNAYGSTVAQEIEIEFQQRVGPGHHVVRNTQGYIQRTRSHGQWTDGRQAQISHRTFVIVGRFVRVLVGIRPYLHVVQGCFRLERGKRAPLRLGGRNGGQGDLNGQISRSVIPGMERVKRFHTPRHNHRRKGDGQH